MSTIYRPDYAKFLLEMESDRFQQMYRTFCAAAQELKVSGDFLRDHKVTCLPARNQEFPRYVIEVWGEQAAVVKQLHWGWMSWLKRFDIRAIHWDCSKDDVQRTGTALQLGGTSFNVETFNSRPASKRQGRDRGGVGFRIGSRKSDLCAVVYKRGNEPAASEFRFQGPTLRRLTQPIIERTESYKGTVDAWAILIGGCMLAGDARMMRAYEQAGIGTYWPRFATPDDVHLPAQGSFVGMVQASGEDMQEFMDWVESIADLSEPALREPTP